VTAPSLRADLTAWDGVSAEAIGAVYERQSGKRGFVGSAIRASADPAMEAGATWLLKHHLGAGQALTTPQAASFFATAAKFVGWEARLHTLQCTEFVEVPAGSVRDARRLIEHGLADENKLVRAWAYSAFARLAAAHPRYRGESEALLTDAEATESAASVRARIRQIRKKRLW